MKLFHDQFLPPSWNSNLQPLDLQLNTLPTVLWSLAEKGPHLNSTESNENQHSVTTKFTGQEQLVETPV